MNPVMYLIVNKSIQMSRGKAEAQSAHAAVAAYRLSLGEDGSSTDLVDAWFNGGHYTKIVLEADDLFVAREYIEARGFDCEMIIDEGRTEFDGRLTPTFLGVEIVDKDQEHVQATFSAFKLRKDPPPEVRYEHRVLDRHTIRGQRDLRLSEVMPYLHQADLLLLRHMGVGDPESNPSVPKTLFGYPLSLRADLACPGTPSAWRDMTDCIKHKNGEAVVDTDKFLDRVSEIQAREGR